MIGSREPSSLTEETPRFRNNKHRDDKVSFYNYKRRRWKACIPAGACILLTGDYALNLGSSACQEDQKEENRLFVQVLFVCLLSTTLLSHWDFFHEKYRWLPRGKPAATESPYSTYSVRWVFYCFLNPPNSSWTTEYFNVRM